MINSTFEKKDLKIKSWHTKEFREFPPMFHMHAEIIYILSGEGEFVIDGQKRKLGSGDLSFSFPYSVHSYAASSSMNAIIVLFNPELVQGFRGELLTNKPECPFMEHMESIRPLLEKIVAFGEREGHIGEETVKGYLTAAIGEILTNMRLKSIGSNDISTTQKILIYCEENFKKDINIKTISKHLFVSQSYISQIFASKLYCSFRSYINGLRMHEAIWLLENTDMRIIEIMYECGFKNQSSFNRIFYDAYAMTPSEFRKRRLRNEFL